MPTDRKPTDRKPTNRKPADRKPNYEKPYEKKYKKPEGETYKAKVDKREVDKRTTDRKPTDRKPNYEKPYEKKYKKPEGETYKAKVDKREVDKRTTDRKPTDRKPTDRKPNYEKPYEKKYKKPEGETYKAKVDKREVDKRTTDRKPIDRKPTDRKPNYEKPYEKKYKKPEGETYKAKVDKREVDKRTTDKRPTDRRTTDKRPTDRRTTDKRPTDRRIVDNRAVEVIEDIEKKEKPLKLTICEQCGGCLGQTEPYEKQIIRKQKRLEEILEPFCKLDSMVRMEKPLHYRNKVFSVFHHDKTGPVCGIYKQDIRQMISMDNCGINSPKATAIIISIRNLLKSFKIKTYDVKTGHGLLRYVLVREAKATGEIMVVLVLSSHIMPSKNNFVKALRELHPEIDTIIINENYKISEKLLGDKETTIFGKGFLLDTIAGKTFRVSSKSLYPINVVQTEALCKKVVELANFSKEDILLDAYCGIGTIGIVASDYVKRVISIDSNPEVIRDAVSNVKRNQIKNVDFYTNQATELVIQIAESEKQKPNVVVMDPPKGGSTKEFLAALVELNPEKIIYVSRNAYALGNELNYLLDRGYRIKKAVGIDMLPWTEHLETVVLLVRE